MVVRLELAPICVAQSFLQHFAPFELHINIKTLLTTPPYEKYTFSERKLHEESKYDVQKCVGGRGRMSGLRKSTFLDQIWNFPSCVIRLGKNVYFPASWAKFPSSRVDFPPVWDGFPYVFLYFFPPNHKISRQGASHFACFFHACVSYHLTLNPYFQYIIGFELLMKFPFRKCILEQGLNLP